VKAAPPSPESEIRTPAAGLSGGRP
jgi:hypothetical protein